MFERDLSLNIGISIYSQFRSIKLFKQIDLLGSEIKLRKMCHPHLQMDRTAPI